MTTCHPSLFCAIARVDMHPILHATVDRNRLTNRLNLFFGINEVFDVSVVHGGFMCQNFRIDSDKGVFFLKQYRNRVNTVVNEIKKGETYFASHGLPIILPLLDTFGRQAFWIDGHWFSLFPFIEKTNPKFGTIKLPLAQSLGSMLADFHSAGMRHQHQNFQQINIGNLQKFHLEKVELELILNEIEIKGEIENAIHELLEYKMIIVKKNNPRSKHLYLKNDCLLHGDYQYFNIFADDGGNITHVYDLEKVSFGPRSFELARALLLNCFDDGWNDFNYGLGKAFLESYLEKQPMDFSEFEKGMQLYAYQVIHTTWIEARYLIYGLKKHLEIFDRHANRIHFISSDAFSDFCHDIFPHK
jgi:Ser/Thr protein kinase RdoA (MazF antagonist)